MQTLTTPNQKTVRVSSKQINEAAISVKTDFPVLYRAYSKQSAEVATQNKGFTDLVADSVLAKLIRHL